MRKSDKKIDNLIITALTKVCHTALDEIDGFEWLTHSVNYEKFPESLVITCVFNSNKALACFLKSSNREQLTSLVSKSLAEINIKLKNVNNQIELDSEENCTLYHAGNWNKRLSNLQTFKQ